MERWKINSRMSLSKDKEDDLLLEPNIVEDPIENLDDCLVGRLLMEQTVNFSALKTRLTNIWKPKRGISIKEVGCSRFLFQFFHPLDLKRILDGSPWSFGNWPLIVHHLKKGEYPLRVPLNSILFWIHVYDLPLGYTTESVGKQLGNFIGRFLEYDKTNKTVVWRPYMRLRVEIDVSQPLKRCKKIHKANGEFFVVAFKYEKLNSFCFICGRLGHTEKFYEDLFNAAEGVEIKREWGVWLKAPERRSKLGGISKWIRDDSGDWAGPAYAVDKATGEGNSSMHGRWR